MLSIPSSIQSALKNGAQKNLRITFPNGERGDICNPNIIPGSVSFKESVCSADSLKFGLSEASVLAFETVGIENITNCKIEVFLEVFCDSSVSGSVYRADLGSYVYPIPYGIFIVDECLRQNNIDRRKSTAYSVGVQSNDWGSLEKIRREIVVPSKLAYQYNPLYVSLASLEMDERISGLRYQGFAELTEEDDSTNTFTEEIDATSSIEYVFLGVAESYGSDSDRLLYLESDVVPFADIEAEIRQYCASFSAEKIQKIVDAVRSVFENPMSISINEFDWSGGASIPNLITSRSNLGRGSYVYTYLSHPNIDKGRVYATFRSFTISNINHKFIVSNSVSAYHAELSNNDFGGNRFPLISLTRTKIGTNRYVCKEEENYTPNECLEGCIEILGAFGRRNRNGEFSISLIDNGFVNPSYTLSRSEYMDCWYEEHPTLPYGKVGCNYIGADGEEAYIEEKIQNVEPFQTYDLSNNPIIKNVKFTVEEIQALLDVFAENVQNISYVATDISALGLPFLEGGDVIDVEVGDGESIQAFIETRTLSGVNSLRDKFDSEADNNKIGEWHEAEQTAYNLILNGLYQNGFALVGKAYRSSLNGSNGVTGTPTITENYSGGYVRAYHSATASNGNRACSICSNAKIDLTNYSTLHVEYTYIYQHRGTTSTKVGFVIPSNEMSAQGYAVVKSEVILSTSTSSSTEYTLSGTVDIDVSELNGLYHVGADITYRPNDSGGKTDMRIKNMWLE